MPIKYITGTELHTQSTFCHVMPFLEASSCFLWERRIVTIALKKDTASQDGRLLTTSAA